MYNKQHWAAILAAFLIASLIIYFIGTGSWDYQIGQGRSLNVRVTAYGVFMLAIALWFVIEEKWAPKTDKEQLLAFRENQAWAHKIWIAIAGILALIYGLEPPNTTQENKTQNGNITAPSGPVQ